MVNAWPAPDLSTRLTWDAWYDIVCQKAQEEYDQFKGRQSWEYTFIKSKWAHKLEWLRPEFKPRVT